MALCQLPKEIIVSARRNFEWPELLTADGRGIAFGGDYNPDQWSEDIWDDDIRLYKGYSWEDYGKEMLDCCGYEIPEQIIDFIDLERYGRYCGEEYLQEYSDGLIEIQ